MAPNLNFSYNSPVATSIASAASIVANVASSYLVSANSAPAGVNGFLFDILDDEEISLDSDITDNWTELNVSIQDHIALKPVKFTLRGFMGELNDIFDTQVNDLLTTPIALLPVSFLTPTWNAQDNQFYTKQDGINSQAKQAISQITSLATVFGQLTGAQTRQQSAYNMFFNFWQNRILCTVQTPYGLLTNMAIESVRSLQSGKSQYVSDFSVTFKQINQVGTSVTPTVGNPNPNGSATQTSPLQGISSVAPNTSATDPSAAALPQNFPSQIQSGINGSPAAGRIADATVPMPDAIGPSTTGVPDYDNTNIPVDVTTSFTQNPTYTATIPQLPPTPTIRPMIPSLPLPLVP